LVVWPNSTSNAFPVGGITVPSGRVISPAKVPGRVAALLVLAVSRATGLALGFRPSPLTAAPRLSNLAQTALLAALLVLLAMWLLNLPELIRPANHLRRGSASSTTR